MHTNAREQQEEDRARKALYAQANGTPTNLPFFFFCLQHDVNIEDLLREFGFGGGRGGGGGGFGSWGFQQGGNSVQRGRDYEVRKRPKRKRCLLVKLLFRCRCR